jgi:pilus assembly protein CpaB
MGRRVKAVLAAMLVGLIGVVAVLVYASGADARAVADQRPQTVFVAQEVIPLGTTAADAVARGLMVPTKIAAKGVPAGALTAVEPATGKLVALTDIAAGDFVVASRFGTAPKTAAAIDVPKGQVAISFALSDPGRVGSFMTPGSHIVLYDTSSAPAPAGQAAPAAGGAAAAAAGGRTTQVLLDDALVIAVGSTSLTPVPKAADGTTPAAAGGTLVTVALPPAMAAKLVHGIQTGTLYAGLAGTNSKALPGQVVSDSNLFNK